jgi:hypothetical protein
MFLSEVARSCEKLGEVSIFLVSMVTQCPAFLAIGSPPSVKPGRNYPAYLADI